MADAVTFRNALERCGITQGAARDAFPAQGYSTMAEFAELSPGGIEAFVKAVNKLPAAAPNEPRPQVPFASVKKLKAMRWWTMVRNRCGIEVVHTEFTPAELERVMTRLDYEAHLSVNKPDVQELADKFVSFGPKWKTFSENFSGHCAAQRGCMDIPLSYVFREHEDVTDEMRGAAYDDSDARLMAIVMLQGDEYLQDRARVWNLLRPLVYGTPAWDYVKQYDARKDGRGAFRTLLRRGEGEAAMDARRTKAEATIAKAQYTGTSRRFTLQNYINLLQGAFTELDECGEPYSERKKVDVFVRGLIATRFAVTKQAIIQSPTTREDFQAAYAFVETMEQYNDTGLTSRVDGLQRSVSSIGKDGKTDTKYRSYKEWMELPKEERDRIIEARKKKGGGQRGRGKGKDQETKRKMAELATEILRVGEESTSAGEAQEEPSDSKKQKADGSPASQFGRHAHSTLMKLAQGVKDDWDKKKSSKK